MVSYKIIIQHMGASDTTGGTPVAGSKKSLQKSRNKSKTKKELQRVRNLENWGPVWGGAGVRRNRCGPADSCRVGQTPWGGAAPPRPWPPFF